jgi:hypothetical protein
MTHNHLGALVTNSLARVWAAVTSVAEKTSGKASVLSKVPKCAEFHAKFKVVDGNNYVYMLSTSSKVDVYWIRTQRAISCWCALLCSASRCLCSLLLISFCP